MVEEIRQIGNYIRLPFEILGSVLNFLLSNFFLILILVGITWLVWKYWWAILVVFFKLYDLIKKKKEIQNGKEEIKNSN